MTLESGARGFRKGVSLHHEAAHWTDQTWAPPRVEMSRSLGNPKHITKDRGKGFLEDQVQAWATPTVGMTIGGQMSRSGDRDAELLLNGQAHLVSFLLDRGIFEAGLRFSESDQTSRPSCVEPSMWPTPAACVVDIDTMERNTSAGYVRQAQREAGSPYLARVSGVLNPAFVEWMMGWPIGWTASECSATALSRFRRDMRSVLSRLPSPPAPVRQASLFC